MEIERKRKNNIMRLTLQETNSEILKEWDYKKNSNSPDDVTPSSHERIWWVCNQGHSWPATVANRFRRKQGCPYCSGRLPIPGENDLFSTNPELKKEWDYVKNKHLDPAQLKANSSKEAYWICDKGHSWAAKILYRGARGHGCPYCAGVRTLAGFNDLQSSYPDIAEEWDFEKNGISPSEVAAKIKDKYWWKCSICGYSYSASIYNRTRNNSSCPKCSFRFKTSFPEQAVLYYLKKIYPDIVNGYRGSFLQGMELDLYIPNKHIGIEYDGQLWHKSSAKKKKDIQKYRLCKDNDIKLIRIKEKYANEEDADVIIKSSSTYDQECFDHIFAELNKQLGIVIVPDIEKDRALIQLQYRSVLKENSLSIKYPEIAKEWDYENNHSLLPSMFSPKSNDKVAWICPLGHHYSTVISNRTRNNTGCPYCSGKKVLTGFNDLKTVYPDIASEWDYDKNGELLPTDVHSGAHKKVWWICPKGHPSYESYIYSRTGTNKTNCPVCSNKTVVSGINDLATLYPELLKEWDYENNEKDPTTISPGIRYEAQWHCSKGHVWTEKVLLRALRNFGCPYCSRHRVIKGVNDLKTLYPQIAKEWNYSKNGQLRPENYLPKSNKEVWWICNKGHEWPRKISERHNNGCPYCSGRLAVPGENDFQTLYPDMVKDWDYKLNGDIRPNSIKPFSHYNIHWKCHICGHEWVQKISNRVKRKSVCPRCKE